jgi:hypothetical protein
LTVSRPSADLLSPSSPGRLAPRLFDPCRSVSPRRRTTPGLLLPSHPARPAPGPVVSPAFRSVSHTVAAPAGPSGPSADTVLVVRGRPAPSPALSRPHLTARRCDERRRTPLPWRRRPRVDGGTGRRGGPRLPSLSAVCDPVRATSNSRLPTLGTYRSEKRRSSGQQSRPPYQSLTPT